MPPCRRIPLLTYRRHATIFAPIKAWGQDLYSAMEKRQHFMPTIYAWIHWPPDHLTTWFFKKSRAECQRPLQERILEHWTSWFTRWTVSYSNNTLSMIRNATLDFETKIVLWQWPTLNGPNMIHVTFCERNLMMASTCRYLLASHPSGHVTSVLAHFDTTRDVYLKGNRLASRVSRWYHYAYFAIAGPTHALLAVDPYFILNSWPPMQ